jgi:hypothetical protein
MSTLGGVVQIMDYDEGSIRIEGLTPLECWYLDILWRIQTQEELDVFKSFLSPEELAIVEKLQMLLLMEVLEQNLSKKTEFKYANDYLKRFMKP